MTSTTGHMHRLLVRQETSSLDAAGVHLVLDGRLSSAEGREGLKAALRQASQQSGELRSRVETAIADSCRPATGALMPQPTCLSSQAHQLPEDMLNAFQEGASASDIAADVTACGIGGNGMEQQACSRVSTGSLVQQDSLVHPPIPVTKCRSQVSSGGSGTVANSPPQWAFVSTAIERTSTATLDANGGVDHGIGMHDPSCTCPPYAVKSTCGKRQAMEDTYALCPNICELPMSPMSHEFADKLPHRIAVQFDNHCMYVPVPDEQQQQQQRPASSNLSADYVSAAPEHQQPQRQQQTQQQTLGVVRQSSCTQGMAGVLQAAAHAQQQEAAAASAAKNDTAAASAGAAQLLPSPLAATPDAENSVSSLSSSDGGSVEKLHFFGVYDGHGGIEASLHCAQRLHYHLSKSMAEMASMWLESSIGDEAAGSWNPEVRYVPLETARVGDIASPNECTLATAADEGIAGSSTGSSGSSSGEREFGRSVSQTSTGNSGAAECEVDSNEGSADGSEGTAASFGNMMEEVLREAFLKTDEEFSNSGLQAGLVGSTAVVALVGTHRVWIANCGDSRAVLSRAGVAYQVTDDHKPEREDEAERVEKAGGQVLYWNGHRVMGVLAMSRAIGDHCLRPYVIPEPEITVFARHPRDEILLLASDGLWDVLSNQDATDLALRSIKRAREKGASRKAAARVAATVLTKAAVDRGSRDNITVVIIDLAPQTACERVADKAANANGPPSPESSSIRQSAACEAGIPAEAAAPGNLGSRPGSSSSNKNRPGSSKSSCNLSNPFAAAAASPFSTAATGSSELPLPSGATGGGSSSAGCEPVSAVMERGSRTSTSSSGPGSSGRLRHSGTGSAFGAAANCSSSISSAGVSAAGSGAGADALHTSLSKELDSIDISGVAAAQGAAYSTIHSMAAASSAAEGSTTSSLEEQPTIVEPPSSMIRQASSSPFSAFQDALPAFDTTDD